MKRALCVGASALLLMTLASGCKTDGNQSPSTQTAPSPGLKSEDIVVGTGPSPTSGQSVTVKYVGTLQDGTKFDASADHGDGTFTFTIGEGQVIKGWDEGVMTMKVGGKRKLTIPPDMAYGAEGRPPVIPANATLIFTIELVKVG